MGGALGATGASFLGAAQFPPRVENAEQFHLNRAQQFLAGHLTTKQDIFWKWDDLDQPGNHWEKIGNAAGIQTLANRGSGFISVVSGNATDAFALTARMTAGGGYPVALNAGAGTAFYAAARMRFIQDPTADGQMGYVLRNPVGAVVELLLGADGATDPTRFSVINAAGDVITSTSLIDNTAMAIVETYHIPNGDTHLLVNLVEEGTPTPVFTAGPGGHVLKSDSGATASSTELLTDYYCLLCTGRPAA